MLLLILVLLPGGGGKGALLVEEPASAAQGSSIASSDDKIALEIPPGALTEDTTVSIRVLFEEEWTDDPALKTWPPMHHKLLFQLFRGFRELNLLDHPMMDNQVISKLQHLQNIAKVPSRAACFNSSGSVGIGFNSYNYQGPQS